LRIKTRVHSLIFPLNLVFGIDPDSVVALAATDFHAFFRLMILVST